VQLRAQHRDSISLTDDLDDLDRNACQTTHISASTTFGSENDRPNTATEANASGVAVHIDSACDGVVQRDENTGAYSVVTIHADPTSPAHDADPSPLINDPSPGQSSIGTARSSKLESPVANSELGEAQARSAREFSEDIRDVISLPSPSSSHAVTPTVQTPGGTLTHSARLSVSATSEPCQDNPSSASASTFPSTTDTHDPTPTPHTPINVPSTSTPISTARDIHPLADTQMYIVHNPMGSPLRPLNEPSRLPTDTFGDCGKLEEGGIAATNEERSRGSFERPQLGG